MSSDPSSAVLYLHRYYVNLRADGISCFIGKIVAGALVFADDIVLIAPTFRVMRRALSTCDRSVDNFSIVFNAKKSKCLICELKSLLFT